MLGSMYSAVSGLQAHQTKMNVIGNNIANVNTYGFKASRVTFTDVFYQTINGASAPLGERGGTNPNQMGYGARVNSIDVINTRAGSATTDRALDVYINGDGYIPVRDASGVTKYTRVGILSFDQSGNLVDANGNKVLGFQFVEGTTNARLDADGTTDIASLGNITIPPDQLEKYTGIAIGQNGEITAIKAGDPIVIPTAGTGWMSAAPTVNPESLFSGPLTMSVSQKFSQAGVRVSSNAGTLNNLEISRNGDAYTLAFNGISPAVPGTVSKDGKTVTFQVPDGAASPNNVGASVTVDLKNANGADIYGDPTPATSLGTITPNEFTVEIKTINKAGAEVIMTTDWDGSAETLNFSDPDSGQLNMTINTTKFGDELKAGFKTGVVGNAQAGPGIPEKIAHLATVNFINPDGLTQSGEGYYVESTNSGTPVATIPGNNGTGGLRSGALEMSNVDLSREFTEMIITQRGFQANTRMITVSDEMLSELVNMKR